MNRVFLKYYTDITRINILVSIVFGFLSSVVICFGTVGTIISFAVFRYFQNDQYYFYLNYGYSKAGLMVMAFSINFFIALIVFLILNWHTYLR